MLSDYKMKGKYFEDFQVGDEYISPARTVTETDVVNFAGLSGDYNPVHTDEEFAKNTSVFKTRIAHGALCFSIATGLINQIGILEGTTMAFMGMNSWKFLGPVFMGDTIALRIKVLGTKEPKKPDRGVIILEITIVNQKNEVVQQGEWALMMMRRQ